MTGPRTQARTPYCPQCATWRDRPRMQLTMFTRGGVTHTIPVSWLVGRTLILSDIPDPLDRMHRACEDWVSLCDQKTQWEKEHPQ